MKTEQIRITDEQRQAMKLEDSKFGDVCSIGDTKCINGNVYVCQTGPNMEPDWFFTSELCGDFHSEILGNIVITKQYEILSVQKPVSVILSGVIGEASPHVTTIEMSSTIQAIVGNQSSVVGLTKFSGIGTTILIIEVWANGRIGYPYQGVASCTVILK